ncbi:hypothetical protein TWF506_002300 [Arthrobotrys conoides]|uniref:Uncharacterized protein n=1 Tax=Arthrobotrys conoides TaxID=74498 RepID=A0AAN8NCU1_9PEZI
MSNWNQNQYDDDYDNQNYGNNDYDNDNYDNDGNDDYPNDDEDGGSVNYAPVISRLVTTTYSPDPKGPAVLKRGNEWRKGGVVQLLIAEWDSLGEAHTRTLGNVAYQAAQAAGLQLYINCSPNGTYNYRCSLDMDKGFWSFPGEHASTPFSQYLREKDITMNLAVDENTPITDYYIKVLPEFLHAFGKMPTGSSSGRPSGPPTGRPTGRPGGPPTGRPTGPPTGRPTGPPTGRPVGNSTGPRPVQPQGKWQQDNDDDDDNYDDNNDDDDYDGNNNGYNNRY